MKTNEAEPMIGKHVEIRSVSGVRYAGVIREILDLEPLGELFKLSSPWMPSDVRMVFVNDRHAQIRRFS